MRNRKKASVAGKPVERESGSGMREEAGRQMGAIP